jgi:hypothetical protein
MVTLTLPFGLPFKTVIFMALLLPKDGHAASNADGLFGYGL